MRRHREAAGAVGAKCLRRKGAWFALSSEPRLELVPQTERQGGQMKKRSGSRARARLVSSCRNAMLAVGESGLGGFKQEE